MPDFKIGPTFTDECRAAGIDMNGWAWNTLDGTLMFNDDVPQERRDAIAAVLAAHDPAKQTDPPTPAPLIVPPLPTITT